jgi:hypothetical protein
VKFIQQSLEDIVASLSQLRVDWQDDTSRRVIEKINTLPVKAGYSERDALDLLASDFRAGLIVCQLFLGMSKDALATELEAALGPGGLGVQRFMADRGAYVGALVELGLLEAMTEAVNRKPVWSDVLVERLRSGRGRAISGQRRGRGLEDFAEEIIRKVFGDRYDTRCQFSGARGDVAKCDFAIPARDLPRIVVEAKGYGATGSKMSDIIGDLDTIIREKRNDTTLIFVTDGVTWNQRKSDLRKIVRRQNRGDMTRIYTMEMAATSEGDLCTLKRDYCI